MISAEPTERWNIQNCVDYYEEKVLPYSIYIKTYDFCASLLDRYTPDEQVLAVENFVKNTDINKYSVIFCTILGSLIRNVMKPGYRILCVNLMSNLACTDELKLHSVIPYLLCLLNKEERSTVKTCCLHHIAEILSKVRYISAKDNHLFREYIWPLVSMCKNDESEWVRYTLADLMPQWGLIARRLLELGMHTCQAEGNFDKSLGELGELVGSIYKDLLHASREDGVHLVLLANFPRFAEHFTDEVARSIFRDVVLPWILCGEKYQVAILQESDQYIKLLGGYFFKHAFKYLENNLYGYSELVVYLTLKAVNCHVRMNTDLLEKTLPYLLHPSSWIRTEMQKLIIEILRQLDPTMNFSLIRPMIIPYLLLHPSQVLIIDENTITTHLCSNVRRCAFNEKLLGKEAVLLPQEEEVLGNFLSLITMVGRPEGIGKPPILVQEPEDKVQTDLDLKGKRHSSGSFHKSPLKPQYFEGLGLTGDLECVLDCESPVTHITPTLENLIVSGCQDGRILLWKLNKFDDYSKIKYREIKSDKKNPSLINPMKIGYFGDCVYIPYADCIKIWDSELTQTELSIEHDGIREVTHLDSNVLFIADIHGDLILKDIREEAKNTIFRLGAQKGIVSKITQISEKSVGIGTISGHLLLFDLRFCLPSACYVNSYKQSILSLATYSCKYKPLIDGSQLLMSLSSEIVMWDLATARASALFTQKTENPLQVPYLVSESFYYPEVSTNNTLKNSSDLESKAFFHPKLDRLEHYTRISSNFVTGLTEFGLLVKKAWETRSNVLKILVPPDSTVILSAGEDAVVRIWDPVLSRNSALIGQGRLDRPEYHSAIIPDLLVVQEQSLPPQTSRKKRRDFDEIPVRRKISHSHAINDIAYVNSPKPLLFTGSNDGTIRIWR